jgi:hypothetical protein
MGGGEFIPNGSMHWSIDHDTQVEYEHTAKPKKWKKFLKKQKRICGVDRVAPVETMEVVLRFPSEAEFEAAVDAARASKTNGVGLWSYTFTVPVKALKETQLKNPPHPLAPVRVEW